QDITLTKSSISSRNSIKRIKDQRSIVQCRHTFPLSNQTKESQRMQQRVKEARKKEKHRKIASRRGSKQADYLLTEVLERNSQEERAKLIE
ncbi:hypothetical protein RJ60_05900, partial [Mesotoga sp. B105.6.4]